MDKLHLAKSIVNDFTPYLHLPPITQLTFEDLVMGTTVKTNVTQIKFKRKQKGLVSEAWKYSLANTLYDLYLDVKKERGL